MPRKNKQFLETNQQDMSSGEIFANTSKRNPTPHIDESLDMSNFTVPDRFTNPREISNRDDNRGGDAVLAMANAGIAPEDETMEEMQEALDNEARATGTANWGEEALDDTIFEPDPLSRLPIID
jgi:hypothetical protein